VSAAEPAAQQFVRAQTRAQRCAFVPEVSLWTATALDPIWTASGAWLSQHQAEIPFWAFAWPGGLALARAILDGVISVKGCAVLDVASGSGLVGIAAALAHASSVTCVDLDPIARAACTLNATLNNVAVRVHEDFALAAPAQVVLAGDAFYDARIREALLPGLQARANAGARVYVGDPGRAHLPTQALDVRAEYKVPVLAELESRDQMDVYVLELRPSNVAG
jgi:predicted nicotinamide N-methyase